MAADQAARLVGFIRQRRYIPSMRRLNRRQFLVLGGAAAATGAAVAVVRAVDSPATAERPATAAPTTVHDHGQAGGPGTVGAGAGAERAWSDPAAWSGSVPGPDDVAVVTQPVVLDVDARVAGVVVERGGRLIFDPAVSRRLESKGNVVVKGSLVMRPAEAAVNHRLVLTGARESAVVGGGMDVLDSDVGLWVVDGGTLDLAGASKLAWTRVTGAVEAGATRITLQADPAGWRPGDEIALAPTLGPAAEEHFAAFDTARIRAVDGRTITLDRPTRFAHPVLDAGVDTTSGRVLTAEVANLTRNVGIEGVAGQRAHVFIRANRPQSLKAVTIRHMGPRKFVANDAHGEITASVKGRYGLHFHMCHDGSRGSVVDGVVIRDAGGHAFVPHESNGVTFRGCVAFDVMEDAFWWDGPPGTVTGGANDPGAISDDIVYDRCLAALVRWEPDYEGYALSGFQLGRGTGNVCTNCVAVGVQGNVNASGFEWGENEEGPGIWKFHDNVAHNNKRHGIFWWQVTANHHTVLDFVAYRNGATGILNGSYGDNTHFERCVLVENGEAQFFAWAESAQHDPRDPNSTGQATPQHLVDSYMDSRGLTDYACILAGRAVVDSPSVGEITGNVFKGARKACVAVTFDFHDYGPYRARWKLDRNHYEGNRFWFDGSSHPETIVQTEDGELLRADRPDGALRTAWNAKVS
jgi:G8 domain